MAMASFPRRLACCAFLTVGLLVSGACTGPISFERNAARNLYRVNMYYYGMGRCILRENPPSVLYTRWEQDGAQKLEAISLEDFSVAPIVPSHLFVHDFGYSRFSNAIVYSASDSLEDFSADLYLIQAESTEPRRLTSELGFCFAPNFSPDGRYIAFGVREETISSSANLYVLDLLKDRLFPMTQTPSFEGFPFWTSDGQCLVYFEASHYGSNSPIARNQWHDWQPHLISFPQGSSRGLSSDREYNVYSPNLSKDGQLLYFLGTSERLEDLYLYTLEDLSDLPEPESIGELCSASRRSVAASWRHEIHFPTLSPDSRTLAFVSDDDLDDDLSSHWRTVDIHLCDIKTGVVRRLTNLEISIESPVFSADGKHIYFFVDPKNPKEFDAKEFWKVCIETGTSHKLIERI